MVNFTMLVRDRPNLTAQALQSLTPKVIGKDMNVTILDDRSKPETRQIVYGWCALNDGLPIRNDDPIGTGTARNFVIHSSEVEYGRGDYLYLSDNDVFFKAGWLEALIASYELAWEHGFKVIGAYNHPYHIPFGDATWGDSGLPGHTCVVRQVNALALQSMLMRWEVWDKYGPFCNTPVDKVCQSEDVDFTNKIHADGFKIGVVSPALIVSTGITNTFGEKIPGWELVKAQCPAGVIIE